MFSYFFKREIYGKYIGNITGVSWVFIQPVLTLLIYAFVFERIFHAKFPESENIGFIVYLALGFWPWTAFSEGILKAIPAVMDKQDLIGKVNLDFRVPVVATISASFLLNVIGYVLVLIILIIAGKDFNYSAIPLLILPLFILYIFALGLGLILSAVQVYIRDTVHFFATIMTLWFFMTPIVYSVSAMPDYIKKLMVLNPVYIPINFIHTALLTDKPLNWFAMFFLLLFVLALLWLANKIFNRLADKFEDFL